MLKLTSKGNVRFSWADDAMEAIWTLRPDDSEEELLEKMRKIVTFMEIQQGKVPLPERLPGFALGMAQTAHPAPGEGVMSAAGYVGNGWASTAGVMPTIPELPADRQGEWELIPPEEQ